MEKKNEDLLLRGIALAQTASTEPQTGHTDRFDVPMATYGNILYTAWPNNDTGHFNVFFAKSTDVGKTPYP